MASNPFKDAVEGDEKEKEAGGMARQSLLNKHGLEPFRGCRRGRARGEGGRRRLRVRRLHGRAAVRRADLLLVRPVPADEDAPRQLRRHSSGVEGSGDHRAEHISAPRSLDRDHRRLIFRKVLEQLRVDPSVASGLGGAQPRVAQLRPRAPGPPPHRERQAVPQDDGCFRKDHRKIRQRPGGQACDPHRGLLPHASELGDPPTHGHHWAALQLHGVPPRPARARPRAVHAHRRRRRRARGEREESDLRRHVRTHGGEPLRRRQDNPLRGLFDRHRARAFVYVDEAVAAACTWRRFFCFISSSHIILLHY